MASKTIEAAGGIVLRKGAGKLIAVVQRAKDGAWVLPRGKLKRDENPAAAARREVVEETGHRVEVHEFVGAITYRAGGRPKVVQFWRMEAEPDARHELMPDILAVEWLPLKAAVRRLSYPLEKLFLRHAAARALKSHRAEAHAEAKPAKARFKKAKRKKAKLKKASGKPGKTNAGKKKADKTRAKAGSKSRPAKVSAPTKKTPRKLAKPPQKVKAAKGKAAKDHKARSKDRKKNKVERKADVKAGRRSGKAKKDKGRKADREHPATAAETRPDVKTVQSAWPAAETHTPEPARSGSSTAPVSRSGREDESDERKTILQRMLGRLAG